LIDYFAKILVSFLWVFGLKLKCFLSTLAVDLVVY